MAIGAGGVWLIRNWIQFGSPLAPAGLTIAGLEIFPGESFQQSRHLSVLAEIETESFDLWARTRFYLDHWFGAWFLPAMIPALIFVGDFVMRIVRRDSSDRMRARTLLLVTVVVFGAGLIWLLIGAPWTGLERNKGLSLRYILPVLTLLPTVALIGLFPLSLPWFERRSSGTRLVMPRWAMAVAALALAAWFVPFLADRHKAARRVAEERFSEQMNRSPGREVNDWPAAFPALLSAERAADARCEARRIFALIRFDEPLSLQPMDYSSVVFYAGRDTEANRSAGPLRACDYVITSPALAETQKGAALADALAHGQPLRTVATTPDFIVMMRPPG